IDRLAVGLLKRVFSHPVLIEDGLQDLGLPFRLGLLDFGQDIRRLCRGRCVFVLTHRILVVKLVDTRVRICLGVQVIGRIVKNYSMLINTSPTSTASPSAT